MPLPSSSRRQFLRATAALGAGAAAGARFAAAATKTATAGAPGGLVQPPLPFAADALAPAISAETIGFHYGKHHKSYYDNVRKMTEGGALAGATLEQVIAKTANDPDKAALFNNAAQAWNHDFYWRSLSPKQTAPSAALGRAITRDFGSLDALKTQLTDAAVKRFGSGWGWLVVDGGKLKVTSTSNADLPLAHNLTALLTIDVWEHAYYLDHQNKRGDYVTALADGLMNWDFASANFSAAHAG
jgi:Fe-Mn family superoxide dismutase